MRKSLIAASLLALSVAVAPACATKKYVKTEVGNHPQPFTPEEIMQVPEK